MNPIDPKAPMNASCVTALPAPATPARTSAALAAIALLALAAGCKTLPNQAPVEDRSHPVRPAPPPEPPKPAPAPAAAPAADTGQTYTIKAGDNLWKIANDTHQKMGDLIRWNAIENPDRIEVGQVLKVSPPPNDSVAVTRPVPATPKVDAKPLPPAGAASGTTTVTTTTVASGGVAAPVNAATPAAAATAHDDAEMQWSWPAAGSVTTPFDEGKNKGVNIAGKAGDPVYAAADGQVVYAGSGLYGYGNLVIVKHNATFLTAYAFNRALLVKEDQFVKKGQKIAEMGNTGTDRVQLHFEVRKAGKPIDPSGLLPAR